MNIEIKKEGDGVPIPRGSQITVHYTGTLLNGKKFDSSVDRREPFTFPLGAGRVIPCWDEGFKKLTVGAEAILTCPPDMAYGSRGAGRTIPPNSTLKFEVSVLGFR